MISGHIKTLIIGCGNIAGGFDIGQNSLPYTHAGAYKHHGKFDIIACVDPNKIILEQFAANWAVKHAFLNMKEVHASGLDFDVISICSPTSFHHENICEALKLKPKLIFCEKPLANTLKEVLDIKKMCEQANVKLAVNYTRRWDPKIIELRNQIAKGELGKIRSVVGYYNKGVLNNGSHMIDLLLNLFGSLNVVKSISAVNDFFKDDLTVSALLNTNFGLPVHLVAAHASDYTLFELEIISSKKIITMRDGGLSWSSRMIAKDVRFKEYKNLEKEQYYEGKYLEAMLSAAKNIYNAITKDEQLLCTGKEACDAHKICFDLSKITFLNNSG
jgi:predicted dehydrogenase